MERTVRRPHVICAVICAAALAIAPAARANHIDGVIAVHGTDGTLVVQTDDSSQVVILLADGTKVRRLESVRSIKVSTASLIPGLRVQIHGEFSSDGQRFVAERVTFSNTDQKIARAIQVRLSPIEARSVANEEQIAQQAAELRQQHQHIERHEDRIAADDSRIVATTGIAETNSARIANLDNYEIIGTVTVYFENGQAVVQARYREPLQRLIDQARDLNGYVFQVQGYASQVGSDALNERLSAERAQAVARVLEQGGVPPTNLTVPAAMGTSLQVASNASEKGQAENRRAVVTLMQNKGIANR